MKRAVPVILSLLCALCACASCGKVGNDDFARTPEAEYVRVASLAGDNVIFNFDSLTSFEVEHKGSYLSDKIVSDDGVGVANVSAIYQMNVSGDVKTYASNRYIWMFSDDGSGAFRPQYNNGDPQGYQNGAYYWGAGNAPDTRAYEDILRLSETHGIESPDSLYRKTLTLPKAEILENFEGGKASGTYTVKATVKTDCLGALKEWMCSFYHYLELDEDNGSLRFIDFDADYAHKATLTIRSTRSALTDVVLELDTFGKTDVAGALKFEARSTFKSGRVQVRDIISSEA